MTTRLFSILLMIVALAAGCASSAQTNAPNVAVEAIDDPASTTSRQEVNSASEVETIEVTAVGSDAESAADAVRVADFDPTGTWDSEGVEMSFTVTGSQVTGQYGGDEIQGTLGDGVIEGLWFNDDSTTTCTDERAGSTAWGEFIFTFSDNYTTFTGEWGYCDQPYEAGWSGTQISGPALVPQSISSGLPVTTDYAYLTVELLDMSVTPRPPADLGAFEIDDDEQALVLAINIDNRNVGTGWSIPHNGLFWVDIDGELYEPISSGTIDVDPGKDTDAVIVVAVPDDVDLRDAKLWLQEWVRNPDLRTRPAFIAGDGTTDGGFEAIELSNIANGFYDFEQCGGSYELTRVVLDDEPGFKENGAAVWDPWTFNMSPRNGLGRPLDGHLFATTFGVGFRAPTHCGAEIRRLGPNLNVAGVPRDPVSALAERLYDWTDAPSDDIWTFNVPDDSLVVEINIPLWDLTITAS